MTESKDFLLAELTWPSFFDFFNDDIRKYIFYLLNARDCYILSRVNKKTFFVITNFLYPTLFKNLDFFIEQSNKISDEQISKIRLILKNQNELTLDTLNKYLNKKSPLVRPITDHGKFLEKHYPPIFSCYLDLLPVAVKYAIQDSHGNIFNYRCNFYPDTDYRYNVKFIIINCHVMFCFFKKHSHMLCMEKTGSSIQCYIYIYNDKDDIEVALYDDNDIEDYSKYEVFFFNPLLIYAGRNIEVHLRK
jgi:hypothetical protein